MKYLNYYKDRTEIKSEMYDNKPFVTYVEKDNTVFYDKNSVKIPDSLKSKIRALWIADGKSNEDSDRNIIVDRSGNGHNLELSGFSFSKNSGYGKYSIAFKDFPYEEEIINISDSKVVFNSGGQLLLPYPSMNKDIPSFRIKVSGLSQTYHFRYYYRSSDGVQHSIDMAKDGYYDLPICYNIQNSSDGTNCGFGNNGTDVVTIEQIPEYQGAVVTDGVDDIIKSSNTISEILGDSSKCTVLSMMVNLDNRISNSVNILGSRYLRSLIGENRSGKYGIFGYSSSNINTLGTIEVINNILGDSNDYLASYVSAGNVQDYFFVDGHLTLSGDPLQVRNKAWYWSLIANDELTNNEINLLIQYYDLDRWIRPIAYYNPKRQGLTNDNHTEFNDKLLDLSGNGRDLTLYNFSYDLGSGINKYPVSFGKNKTWNDIPKNFTVEYTGSEAHITHANHAGNGLFFHYVYQSGKLTNIKEIPSFRIRISGLENGSKFVYRYLATENAVKETLLRLGNGIHDLPKSFTPTSNLVGDVWVGSTISSTDDGTIEFDCDIKLDILPEIEGALVFDGIDDYAQYQGELGLKDYTVIVDREYQESIATQVPIVSHISSSGSVNTPFLIEHLGLSKILAPHSYGKYTEVGELNISRFTSYQSTYKYNGTDITKGTSTNTGNGLTIGRFGNERQYAMICLYSMLIYPYSMSKFLMNRQLEKYNLNKLI